MRAQMKSRGEKKSRGKKKKTLPEGNAFWNFFEMREKRNRKQLAERKEKPKGKPGCPDCLHEPLPAIALACLSIVITCCSAEPPDAALRLSAAKLTLFAESAKFLRPRLSLSLREEKTLREEKH